MDIPSINKCDVDAFINFIIVWSDINDNKTYDDDYYINDKYLHINDGLPIDEFTNFIHIIKFYNLFNNKYLYFNEIHELLSNCSNFDKYYLQYITYLLMLIGDKYKLWDYINPRDKLIQSNHINKYILCSYIQSYIYMT